jgi:hypothetical protein
LKPLKTARDWPSLAQEEIGDFVGHASTYMVDRYRHLLEGQRERAAERLDAFLAGPQTAQTAPLRRKGWSVS